MLRMVSIELTGSDAVLHPFSVFRRNIAMKKSTARKTAVVGLAAMAAVGLGSFALWSDSADVDGATIVAGNLDIEALDTQALDISPDRADNSHVIDLATWRAVPGDVVEITQGLDIALEGDNLAAEIDMSALASQLGVTEEALDAGYVTVDAVLTDLDGAPLAETDGVYRFQAPLQGGNADKGGVEVGATADEVADVNAVITVNFSANTPDQVLTEATLVDFEATGVTLEQVREGAGFNAVTP